MIGVFQRRQRRGVLLPVEGPAEEEAAAAWCAAGRARRDWPQTAAVGEGGGGGVEQDDGRGRSGGRGRAGRRRASRSGRRAAGRRRGRASGRRCGCVRGWRAISASGSSPSERVEDEGDGRAVPAEQGEVDAVGQGRGAQGQAAAAGDPQGEHEAGRLSRLRVPRTTGHVACAPHAEDRQGGANVASPVPVNPQRPAARSTALFPPASSVMCRSTVTHASGQLQRIPCPRPTHTSPHPGEQRGRARRSPALRNPDSVCGGWVGSRLR